MAVLWLSKLDTRAIHRLSLSEIKSERSDDVDRRELASALADRDAGSQETTLHLGELSAEDRAILDEYLQKPVRPDLNPASQADAEEGADGE